MEHVPTNTSFVHEIHTRRINGQLVVDTLAGPSTSIPEMAGMVVHRFGAVDGIVVKVVRTQESVTGSIFGPWFDLPEPEITSEIDDATFDDLLEAAEAANAELAATIDRQLADSRAVSAA